ncbi:MAG: histidine triad nucleotide-binding protein [Planctomycetota bacterium]|jgi:histidine triad (HIT) family protein
MTTPSSSSSSSCLFCKFVAKTIPTEVVAETDDVLAFNDINPQAPHHVLIIPKQHIASANELTADNADVLGKMTMVARQIAENHDFADDGYRLVINTNRHAGQSVFHIHMHVLAGRYLTWPPG